MTNQNSYNVFVIAVSFNSEKYINDFISSVINSDYPVTLVLVDNGSNDQTSNIAERFGSQVVILRQKANTGFGIGNNIGIKYALDHGADYLFLLNTDMKIEPDTIRNLLNAAKRNPDYGIISPVCLNFEGDQLEKMFAESLFEKNNLHSETRKIVSGLFIKKQSSIYQTSFINAAHWFMPAETIQHIGGFDPIFTPAYHEDDEMCIRVLKHGMKIGFITDCVVYHDTENRKASKFLPEIHFVLTRYYEKIIHSNYFITFYLLLFAGILRTAKHLIFFNRENLYQNLFFFFPEMLRKRRILKDTWRKNKHGEAISLCTVMNNEYTPVYLKSK